MLENLLRTSEASRSGAYQVRLCIGGVWTVITIDDRIPCDSRFKGIAFTRGRGRQLWVPLIEKACAKVAGSYSAIEGGNIAEGLRMLTGAPVTSLHIAVCATNEELKHARAIHTAAKSFVAGKHKLPATLRPAPLDTPISSSAGITLAGLSVAAEAQGSLRSSSGSPPGSHRRSPPSAVGAASWQASLPPVMALGPPDAATISKVWDRIRGYCKFGYVMGASCGLDINTVAVSKLEI